MYEDNSATRWSGHKERLRLSKSNLKPPPWLKDHLVEQGRSIYRAAMLLHPREGMGIYCSSEMRHCGRHNQHCTLIMWNILGTFRPPLPPRCAALKRKCNFVSILECLAVAEEGEGKEGRRETKRGRGTKVRRMTWNGWDAKTRLTDH